MKLIRDIPNCIYLEHQEVIIEGYKIFGTPFIPPVGNWAFMLNTKEERIEKFREIPEDVEILISHSPPKNILDSWPDRPMDHHERYGCNELLKEVTTRIKPLFHIFGHVHEGYGTQKLGSITYINASNVDFDYECVNKPIFFELPRK